MKGSLKRGCFSSQALIVVVFLGRTVVKNHWGLSARRVVVNLLVIIRELLGPVPLGDPARSLTRHDVERGV